MDWTTALKSAPRKEYIGGYSDNEITMIEQSLQIKISGTFREFISTIGKCNGGILDSMMLPIYMFDGVESSKNFVLEIINELPDFFEKSYSELGFFPLVEIVDGGLLYFILTKSEDPEKIYIYEPGTEHILEVDSDISEVLDMMLVHDYLEPINVIRGDFFGVKRKQIKLPEKLQNFSSRFINRLIPIRNTRMKKFFRKYEVFDYLDCPVDEKFLSNLKTRHLYLENLFIDELGISLAGLLSNDENVCIQTAVKLEKFVKQNLFPILKISKPDINFFYNGEFHANNKHYNLIYDIGFCLGQVMVKFASDFDEVLEWKNTSADIIKGRTLLRNAESGDEIDIFSLTYSAMLRQCFADGNLSEESFVQEVLSYKSR